eukprot:3953971-Heterocapsa_arctica.AAC.1
MLMNSKGSPVGCRCEVVLDCRVVVARGSQTDGTGFLLALCAGPTSGKFIGEGSSSPEAGHGPLRELWEAPVPSE